MSVPVADLACFTTSCRPETGDVCAGDLALKSPEGVSYGGGHFSLPDTADLPENANTVTFSIPLTSEGQAAFKAGGVVVVSIEPDEETVFDVGIAGYRAFMQG